MDGVSLSNARYSAYSRKIQFHKVHVGDSEEVVTIFMQDNN